MAALAIALGLTGCASDSAASKKTDYDALPGTQDMAQGPGLLSGDHYDEKNGGGTLLYSSDSPERSVFGRVRSGGRRDSNNALQTPPAKATVPTSPSDNAASGSSDDDDFKQFEAYQRFQKRPADSPEKQRFEDWQQWRRYQQWQRQR